MTLGEDGQLALCFTSTTKRFEIYYLYNAFLRVGLAMSESGHSRQERPEKDKGRTMTAGPCFKDVWLSPQVD